MLDRDEVPADPGQDRGGRTGPGVEQAELLQWLMQQAPMVRHDCRAVRKMHSLKQDRSGRHYDVRRGKGAGRGTASRQKLWTPR